MLKAMARGYAVLQQVECLHVAKSNAEFLCGSMIRPDGRLVHAWKDGEAKGLGFADDYAAVMLGLLALFEVDFDHRWLKHSRALGDTLLERFWDPKDRAFYYSDPDVSDLLVRPKELHD